MDGNLDDATQEELLKQARTRRGGGERKVKERGMGGEKGKGKRLATKPSAKHKGGDEWKEASEKKLKLKVALNKYIF